MNFPIYAIRIFDLENEVKRMLTMWMKIGVPTYFVNAYMSARNGASRFRRLFPTTFRGIRTDVCDLR